MAVTDMITSPQVLTAQVATGDPATVNDAYDSTKVANGAKIQPGQAVYFLRSDGSIIKTRYVRLNCTSAPSFAYGQTLVWKDKLKTVVSAVMSEGITTTANSGAGILLNKDATNGNFVFMQVSGQALAVPAPGSTAVGDALICAASQAFARVAAGTAPTNKPMAWALTNVSSNLSDMDICCE